MSAKKITKNDSSVPAKENKPAAAASSSSSSSSSIVTITLNRDLIQKKAYELALMKKKYEDYIWIFTEADLQLSKAIVSGFGPNISSVKIDKSKVLAKVDDQAIKDAAKANFNKKTKLEDLQWFIAERKYVLDNIK
jgi:hypothetical protein